jgi:hypothetical protein
VAQQKIGPNRNIRISDAQWEAVRRQAVAELLTRSDIVRKAITLYLERNPAYGYSEGTRVPTREEAEASVLHHVAIQHNGRYDPDCDYCEPWEKEIKEAISPPPPV